MGIGFLSISLCSLLFGNSQFFMSWNDSFLAPATVGASATNHLWGGLLVEKGDREMSQGCGRIHSGSHGTGPGHGQQGGCWHRGPVSHTGPSLWMDALVSQWRDSDPLNICPSSFS